MKNKLFFIKLIFIMLVVNVEASNPKHSNSLNSLSSYTLYEYHYGMSFTTFNAFNFNGIQGKDRGVRIRFELGDSKLSLGPQLLYRNFGLKRQDRYWFDGNLIDFSYGILLGYRLYETKDKYFKIENILEVNRSYLWFKNFGGLKTSKSNILIFKDNTFTFSFGYRFTYNMNYFEFKYNIVNPKVNFSEQFSDLLEMDGIELSSTKLSFNSFSLLIGISLNQYEMENGSYRWQNWRDW